MELNRFTNPQSQLVIACSAVCILIICSVILVFLGVWTQDDAKILMTALSTIASVVTLTCLLIINNKQITKDSGTSIRPNGSTRSTETKKEPKSRQFNHTQKKNKENDLHKASKEIQ